MVGGVPLWLCCNHVVSNVRTPKPAGAHTIVSAEGRDNISKSRGRTNVGTVDRLRFVLSIQCALPLRFCPVAAVQLSASTEKNRDNCHCTPPHPGDSSFTLGFTLEVTRRRRDAV